jgi:hypothetical protein
MRRFVRYHPERATSNNTHIYTFLIYASQGSPGRYVEDRQRDVLEVILVPWDSDRLIFVDIFVFGLAVS